MALPDLLRRLEAEAAARATAMLEAAGTEAGRIAADTAARLAERRAAAIADRAAAVRAEAARETAAARREATRRMLAARDEALQRVLRRMEQLLSERRESEAVLARAGADLDAALGYLAAGAIRCRPELVRWARARLPAGGAFSVEVDPDVGIGAVLLAADGSVEIDATVEQRLARLRRELTIAAAGELGGSDGTGVG